MKIIFLDIDGVLNTHRNFQKLVSDNDGIKSWQFNNAFDDDCMLNLKKIIEATNAKVVIQSTRRFSESLTIPLEIQFAQYGILPYLLDRTPQIYENDSDLIDRQFAKPHEIVLWMDRTKNIESFVIVDDMDTFGALNEQLIQCNPWDGLTEGVANKAIEMLTK